MSSHRLSGWVLVSLVTLGTAACQEKPTAEPASPAARADELKAGSATSANQAPSSAPSAASTGDAAALTATIGKPAPAFDLPDLDGKRVKLSDFAGKVVVLEWFNPECPFVRNSHTKGSLVDTADRLQKKGVVYLAINSGAPGKQGHGVDVNRKAAETFKLTHPILLDETGAVGKTYGATNTPHIYVIDASGHLAYTGAVDNSPDGEGQSPEGGKLVSYIEEAVNAVLDGKPIPTSSTKAYGCAVKYGS